MSLILGSYKISQDHLELFFSALRQRFASNNNPNVIQLEAALKRMLSVRISPSINANCLQQYHIVTARVSSLRSSEQDEEEQETQSSSDIPDLPCIENLSRFVSNVVAYISGFVGRAFFEKFYFEPCATALHQTDPFYARIRSDFMELDVI
jgi:hypothetical protein